MVVVRPRGGTIKDGIVVITDDPVPKVTLPSPAANAPWPNRAPWESPIADATGIPSSKPTHIFGMAENMRGITHLRQHLEQSTPNSAQSSLRPNEPSPMA